MAMDLLEDLNEPQKQAVLHVDGPLLVLAGAGSGKTRVITRRVANLVRSGIAPWNILALTFTNKAAGEMRQRVEQLGVGRGATVCTFHALCARLLREFAQEAGLNQNYSIYDADDQVKLVKQAIERLNLRGGSISAGAAHGAISRAKNELKTPDALAGQAVDLYEKNIAAIFAEYQRMLAAGNALDFDDLLLKTAFLLRDRPELRQGLGRRYRYILIDEYQDTNRAQYVIAHGLAMEHSNICATGDPDQSIYAWRGADIRNILEFEQDYPEAVVIRLEENYRSTTPILDAASRLISRNTRRKAKKLWTSRPGGGEVGVIYCDDERAEAAMIAQSIVKHVGGGGRHGDAAVFYRVNSLSRVLEDSLMRAGIPYQIARGTEFYNRKEIKDVLAYLRLLVNPADDLSFVRVVNTPARGIGDATIGRLEDYAAGRGISLLAACGEVQTSGLGAGAAKRLGDFGRMIGGLAGGLDRPVRDVMEDVLKRTGLEDSLKKEDEESRQAWANVEELVSAAEEFDEGGFGAQAGEQEPPAQADATNINPPARTEKIVPLAEYLHQVSLVSDVDRMDGATGAVTLMTLHAAKGLEFPVVFVAGCEEGLLPFERMGEPAWRVGAADDKLEEERRLAFVGMTRAMRQLTLSCARVRMIRGKTTPQAASRFLDELAGEGVKVEDRTTGLSSAGHRGSAQRNTNANRFYQEIHERKLIEKAAGDGEDKWHYEDFEHHAPLPPEYEYLREGSRVRHPKFGVGKVIKLSQQWPQTRAKIMFFDCGPKTLVLAQTSLEIME
ncbi:MAG: UvrD-helicase domain-containing protein [Planctomycetes bacterium]|nr:UvrD-helicase domain-containing protein [Planctomycetota bacterium]